MSLHDRGCTHLWRARYIKDVYIILILVVKTDVGIEYPRRLQMNLTENFVIFS